MTPAELQAFLDALPVPALVSVQGRIAGANQRLAQLTGVPVEEFISSPEPVLRFVAEEDQPMMRDRIAARARGEPVPAEFDYVLVGANRQRFPSRGHLSPFPAAGENAVLLVITHERLRARNAALIRGFVDVAVAAQRESTQEGILRVARDELVKLGFSVTLCELGEGCFRIIEKGAGNPFIGAIQERWGEWIPASAFPMQSSTDGTLVSDLRGVLAGAFGKPRELFASAPPQAMVAALPVASGPQFLFSCSGSDIDASTATAFGLLGKQLGATMETVRRLEELDRRNSELRSQAEEMALLNDIARRLAGSFEVAPLLGLGCESLRRVLDAGRCFVLLPDPYQPTLRFQHSAQGTALGMEEESVAMTAFRERRVVPVIDHAGSRTRLAVPLIARDEVLGVALLLDDHARSFTRVEMDRALAVAGQLALALLSARLYEALRTSYAALARTQKELIDRERLAALGELSASIAHEVRNPLGVIFNSLGSLKRILKPEGDAALLFDIIGEEADRLNRMVGDLLDYSRPVQPALQPVPLRPLFEEAIASARQQAGPAADSVAAMLSITDDTDTVRADARLLRQALLNLFLNAYQAMPRGGRLDVRSSRVTVDGRPCAEIAVRDSGPGIPPDVVDKIFEPFFTTKATGTGLGLAVVRRIVEGHGGSIDLGRSRPGTEFRLRLPLEGL
jgi:signal transduction histidine kinase